jgi:hypothetical protein
MLLQPAAAFLYQSRDTAAIGWVISSSSGREISEAVFLTFNGLNEISFFLWSLSTSDFFILILNMCVLGFCCVCCLLSLSAGLFLYILICYCSWF